MIEKSLLLFLSPFSSISFALFFDSAVYKSDNKIFITMKEDMKSVKVLMKIMKTLSIDMLQSTITECVLKQSMILTGRTRMRNSLIRRIEEIRHINPEHEH